MNPLHPRIVYGGLDLTAAPYLWEFGGDFGSPEKVREVMATLLQDGELVSASRTANREIVLTILVEEEDFQLMAEAEAALVAEADKFRNELLLDPGDSWGKPIIFDTFAADVVLERDDDMESARIRRYALTIPAAPFGRSVEDEVSDAVPVVPSEPTITLVDNCNAGNPGWSKVFAEDTLVREASYLYVYKPSGGTLLADTGVSRTGAVDMSVDNYIIVDWQPDNGTAFPMDHYGVPRLLVGWFDDEMVEPVYESTVGAPPSGGGGQWIRTIFPVSAASFTTMEFRGSVKPDGPQSQPRLLFEGISKSDALPALITERQQQRVVKVEGTAPTEGSLYVGKDGTAGLGMVLVHTGAESYVPALSPWRTGGPVVTPDATMVSGGHAPLNGAIYSVPTNTYPDGGYILAARLQVTGGSKTITTTMQSEVGGTPVGPSHTESAQVSGAGYQFVALASAALPLVKSAAGRLEVTFAESGDTNTVVADELFLLKVSGGSSFTMVDAGTGTPSAPASASHVWIDTPTINDPVPRIWLGVSSDREGAWHAYSVVAWGNHRLVPSSVAVYTVTSGAQSVDSSLRYSPRWLYHAAE